VASFDDLFGGGNSGRKFMKWEQDKETFLFQQIGEPRLVDQKTDDGKVKWMVQVNEGDKWQPKAEGSFDENEVHASFKAGKEIEIDGTVLAKKDASGAKVEDFEPFKTVWETRSGDFRKKLEEAMLETGLPAEDGTVYSLQRLQSKKKPYTYAVKIVAPKE
jgi:hypothetical protein